MITKSMIRYVLSALAISFCQAQEEPKISLQFLGFPKHINPQAVELAISKGRTIEVQTPGNELSPAYTVPMLETIVVGKTVMNEKNEPVFEVYGQAKSLGTQKQIILLMRKGKENRDGFVVVPINGDLGDFGGGSYLFINACNVNVAGVIGDSKFALRPGQRNLLKPKPNFEDEICQVTLSYEREKTWKTFKDTRWSANKSYRTLVFFYQNPDSGRLSVAPVVDILPYESKSDD